MDYFFAQLIAADNNDFDKWGNILFVVIIAIFWVVGIVVNKIKAKEGEHKQQQQPQP